MANPFRNPTQTRRLDHIELRREMKLLLPADLVLDGEEWDELLDFSNQAARQTLLRKACIAATRAGLPKPRTLGPEERTALALFVQGEGPRPSFARYASADGHHGQHWLAPDDRDAPKPSAPWPAQVPGDPGRYVRPTGEYAIPGVEG